MLVVSNTSPVLNLTIIGQLDLLRQQFDEVLITPGVLAELLPDTTFPGASRIQQTLQDGWLRRADVKNVHLVQALRLELDRGEAEAIALAVEMGIKRILIDERDGRIKARAMGLSPTGVLGILLRAKREGSLTSVKSAMYALQRDAGFYIADSLFAAIVIEAGEQ